jgi:RHS repeat-associated protein
VARWRAARRSRCRPRRRTVPGFPSCRRWSSSLFATAPARVDFAVSERCITDSNFDCDPSKIGTNSDYWWDVPWDLHCDSGQDCQDPHGTLAPTFWSRKRLTKVTTKILKSDASGYRDVDSWALTHDWGLADTDRDLLLQSIQHTGLAGGTAVALPPVTFNHVQLANRVDKIGDDISSFIRYRLGAIFDESGGAIDINYSGEDCAVGDTPTPETNTRRCYPVNWQPPGYDDPIQDWFHKYVVLQVVQTDRTGYSPDMVTNYDYQGGAAWHYDDDDGLTKEKYKTWSQWRGYGHVQVQQGGWDAMASQSDHYYFRGMDGDRLNTSGGEKNVTVSDGEGGIYTDDDALAGFELKSVDYDAPAGNIVTKTINTPWRHQTASRTRSWGTVTANLTEVKSTRILTALDGGAWRGTLVTNDYETTAGLKIQSDDQGDTSTTADDRCVTTEYASDTSAWLLNYPSQIRTVAVKCSATPDLSTQLISDVRTYYDNAAWDAAPTAGLVTKAERAKSATSGTVTYITDATNTYDSYGRPLTVTDALGDATTTAYTDTQGLTTGVTVTTPPATPGTLTSSLTTSQVMDPAFGVPTQKTDTGGKVTNLSYDGLGRSEKVWLPTRSTSQTPNLEFNYKIVDKEIVAVGTKTLRNDSTQATGYTLYDGWLRERQTQVPGPSSGRLITDTFYNTQGQVAKKYAAYYAPGAPETALFGVDTPGNVETQNVYSYDGLGRVTIDRLLVGNGDTQEKWRTTTSYGGNWTAVTPPAGGTPTTTINDARGQTVELRQMKGTGPGNYDSTFYDYTPAGQLAKITGPGNQVWTYIYDVRGRKTQDSDPDKGIVKYTYDDLDRLTQIEDARHKKISTSYDGLGRKTALYDSTSASPGTQLAGWVYDTVRKGQLTSSTRYVGAVAYTSAVTSYDNLNRPLRTSFTIPSVTGEDKLAGSYLFGASYNVDNTVAGTSYPTGGDLAAESVPITYDSESLQRPIALGTGSNQYVTNTTYTNTGKPEKTTLSTGGKQAWITQTWESGTQRLVSSRTEREGIAGADRSAAYTYDDAGDVTQINEASRSGTDNQCFRYDYLQRLTQAWAQGTATCAAYAASATIGGPAGYKETYTYDAAGNRATDSHADSSASYSRTYTPPSTGHRLPGLTQTGTGAHTESYGYDASGDTTSRSLGSATQTLTWDNEGELAKISDSAKGDTSFLYDASGNRLLRRDPTGTTLYLPGMEIRQAKGATIATATRYYTYGGQTVAMRTAAGVQFLSSDHHGTTELQINATTQALTQRRFTPFGQPRGTATGSWTGDKGFVGGTTDTSTGLTHLGAREYDPSKGRFISVDPVTDIADPQSLNGYAYAGNTPTTMSDPGGLLREGGTQCGWNKNNPCTGGGPRYHGGTFDDDGWVTDSPDDTPSGTIVGTTVVNTPNLNAFTVAYDIAFQRWQQTINKNGHNPLPQCSIGKHEPGGSCSYGDLLKLEMFAKMICEAGGFTCDKASEGDFLKAALAGFTPDMLFGGGSVAAGRNVAGGRGGQGRRSALCAGANSFISGTKVLMADGKYKLIEKIENGDEVLATDPETGKTEAKKVVAAFGGTNYINLVQVTVDTDGKRGNRTGVVIATEHHLFWDQNAKQWVRADRLVQGDKLRTSKGANLDVVHAVRYAGHPIVRDLTVEDTHTFYVLAGSTPVLVHNSCGPLEGERDYDVYHPANGNRITDIDHIDGGVLWEEKSALYGDDGWITKHIDGKLKKYLEARQNMPGYENAPIGFRFTNSSIDPRFRSTLESHIENLRQANPGVDIRLEFN